MWPGVEPQQGKINTTYLSAMNDVINALGAQGVYTIVDLHQDLLHPLLWSLALPALWVAAVQPAHSCAL